MIKINKRALPDSVVIRRAEDYRDGSAAYKILTEDCHDKCYICEDSVHTAPEVDHRISRQGNPALYYDWNNLFLSCRHCNLTKSNKYDDIIYPAATDPEQYIELSLELDDELRETVVVRKKDGGADVDATVRLLDAVYNGTRDEKQYACRQLKNKISNNLLWFYLNLDEYKARPTGEQKAVIEHMLSDWALFTAFKRKIIQGDPDMQGNLAGDLVGTHQDSHQDSHPVSHPDKEGPA
ncbi:MAG: HNH endonuclease [Gracilibacteraceae bacterium]|jgi:hypothetical protein|nr:HNH endonuclease [Gracilibacteraceae bacterium]